MRWVLFGCLMIALPAPYVLTEVGRVPPLQLLVLGALVGAAALTEGGAIEWVLARYLVLQVLLWTLLCFGAALGLARLLGRIPNPRDRHLALAVIVASLFAASLFEIYLTPLSSSGARANLLRAFD